jgi:hypothetical protein
MGILGILADKKWLVAPITDVVYLHEENPTEGWGASVDLDRDF